MGNPLGISERQKGLKENKDRKDIDTWNLKI